MVRASDDTREHAVARLRDGLSAGRLGIETFVERVEAAYDAKTREELGALTWDLPRRRSWWMRAVDRLDGRVPATRLRPPEIANGRSLTIGRSPYCDYQVDDMAVSLRHAELRREAGCWWIRDLASRNGTRVNGWLAADRRLRDGDELTIGQTRFIFREPHELPIP
jgi:hypothetical protein